MKIPPEVLAQRRQRSAAAWRELLNSGRNPRGPDLARLVEEHGSPTPEARKYVAARLRGEHRVLEGSPGRGDQDHRALLERAWELHNAVETRRAAFELQGIRAPKSRALECVANRVGVTAAHLEKRVINAPLRKGSGGWTIDGPRITAEEARVRVQAHVDAGHIRLDRKEGWSLHE